jgi:hypothetical protein
LLTLPALFGVPTSTLVLLTTVMLLSLPTAQQQELQQPATNVLQLLVHPQLVISARLDQQLLNALPQLLLDIVIM